MKSVLLIEDDLFLQSTVVSLLESHRYAVRTASTATDGYKRVVEEEPSMVILDLGLPDEDGLSLCRRLRARWTFPILMLTSRSDSIDKVLGLEVGADDYLTKPFDARELLARVRAGLRRAEEYSAGSASNPSSIQVGPLTLDMSARRVQIGGQDVPLTTLEFNLLHYFAVNSGRVLKRDLLFETVWGYDEEFNSNSLDVFVYRLRTKLERTGAPRLIHTVRGFGYRMSLDD